MYRLTLSSTRELTPDIEASVCAAGLASIVAPAEEDPECASDDDMASQVNREAVNLRIVGFGTIPVEVKRCTQHSQLDLWDAPFWLLMNPSHFVVKVACRW